MKLKITCIALTVITISTMWLNSPLRKYNNLPTVEIVSARKSNVYNSVIARGYVEAGVEKSLKINKNVKIDKMYFSLGDRVEKGDVILSVSEAENAMEDVQSAFNFLPEIQDISDIESFYNAQKNTPASYFQPQIKSPISGVITQLAVSEGDIAIGYVPLAVISDFNELLIRASVSEIYIEDIKVGQTAEVTGEAFNNKRYTAKVCQISPVAKKKTNITGTSDTTIDVILSIESKNTNLRPGYSVSAKIFTDRHNNATVVPYSCVFQEKGIEYIFVEKDGIIYKKAVKTGFELDDVVEICSGVSAGEHIVNNPTEKLYNKMPVKVGEKL